MGSLGTSLDSPIPFGRLHAQTEKQLEESGIGYALQPNGFMQALLAHAQTIKAAAAIYAPMKDGKISLVDARDIAAVAVAALTEEGHVGQTYSVTGPEALSYTDIADKLSAVLGRKITYVDVPPEAARQGMLGAGVPAWAVDGTIKLFAEFSLSRYAEVSPVVETIAKKGPIHFDQFARDYAQAFG